MHASGPGSCHGHGVRAHGSSYPATIACYSYDRDECHPTRRNFHSLLSTALSVPCQLVSVHHPCCHQFLVRGHHLLPSDSTYQDSNGSFTLLSLRTSHHNLILVTVKHPATFLRDFLPLTALVMPCTAVATVVGKQAFFGVFSPLTTLVLLRTAGATVVVEQVYDPTCGAAVPEQPQRSAILIPRANRFVVFDGRLAHGVLDWGSSAPRASLLFNWWKRRPTVGPLALRLSLQRIRWTMN